MRGVFFAAVIEPSGQRFGGEIGRLRGDADAVQGKEVESLSSSRVREERGMSSSLSASSNCASTLCWREGGWGMGDGDKDKGLGWRLRCHCFCHRRCRRRRAEPVQDFGERVAEGQQRQREGKARLRHQP